MLPFLILVILGIIRVDSCPPQPNGNCYRGSYNLHSILGGFQNEQCSSMAINRDWCTVSYHPMTQQAHFGCATNFPIHIPNGALCGDGPGFINSQGCTMVNTETGPCYFCCCKGGSCNHPQIFAREASKLPINQFPDSRESPPQQQQPSYSNHHHHYYQIPWNNSHNSPVSPLLSLSLLLFVVVVNNYLLK